MGRRPEDKNAPPAVNDRESAIYFSFPLLGHYLAHKFKLPDV